jgi:hypothetical protein
MAIIDKPADYFNTKLYTGTDDAAKVFLVLVSNLT